MIKVEGEEIESFVFNGGEVSVKLPNIDRYHYGDDDDKATPTHVDITAPIYNSDDLMKMVLTVDAVKRKYPDRKITLTIPYLPYARQDRVCNDGEALSLKVVTDIINNLNVDNVHIIDCHSDVGGALLNNCEQTEQHDIVSCGIFGYPANVQKHHLSENEYNYTHNVKYDYHSIVSPDAGAEKKVNKLANILNSSRFKFNNDGKLGVVYGAKIRDVSNGNITETRFTGDVSGKNLLIVDDICDGGRTFIELSKVLKEAGAKKVDLYVTHGIFSKGLECLKPHFNHIYCFHMFPTKETIDEKFLTTFN